MGQNSAVRQAVPLVAQCIGITPFLLALNRKFRTHSIRALIYHSVPQASADGFERQLQYFSRHYRSVGGDELAELVRDGKWNHSKPGLMLTFDDGLRSHAEVAAPLLEKYGFRGWFFVPTAFVDAPIQRQREFAVEHRIFQVEDFHGDRIAMTWDQVRRLAENHVIGGHTANHVRLTKDLAAEDLRREIVVSKSRLEEELARPVESFAWVGGEEWSYSRSAAEAIASAGFSYSFMTNAAPILAGADPLQLDRYRIEPNWSMPMVRWQLAGMMTSLYSGKRRRVRCLTKVLTA